MLYMYFHFRQLAHKEAAEELAASFFSWQARPCEKQRRVSFEKRKNYSKYFSTLNLAKKVYFDVDYREYVLRTQ